MVPVIGGTAAVREEQAFIAAIVGVSHGGVDADVRRDAGQDQVGNTSLAQEQIKIRGKKRAFTWLIDDGFPG
jgi:hypothetical protein